MYSNWSGNNAFCLRIKTFLISIMSIKNIGWVDVGTTGINDSCTLDTINDVSAYSLHTNWWYGLDSLWLKLDISVEHAQAREVESSYDNGGLSLKWDLSFQGREDLNPQFSIAGNKGIISKAIHHVLEINNYIALHACAVFNPVTGKTIVWIWSSWSWKTALISAALRNWWKIVSTEMLVMSPNSIFVPGNTLDTVSSRAADYIEKYLEWISVNRDSVIKDETWQKCLADFTSARYKKPISPEDWEVEIIFLNYGDTRFAHGKPPIDTDYITRILQISASEKIDCPTVVGNNLMDINLRWSTKLRNQWISRLKNWNFKFTILWWDINDFERYIAPVVAPKMISRWPSEPRNVAIPKVKESIESFFLRNSYSPIASRAMADNIVQAELFWRTTHWLVRVPWIINNKIPDGSYSHLVNQWDNIFSADCTEKNWYLCCDMAIELLLDYLAQSWGPQFGVAVLKSVFPSWILIRYLKRFYEKKMMGLIIWTTPRLVADNNFSPRVLWTNPVGYTIPLEWKSPIIADFSTSEMTLWKMLELKQKWEKRLPHPTLLDRNWKLTAWIDEAFSEEWNFVWSLIPFWWTQGMHKGMMISLLIEIVTSFLGWMRSEKWDLVIVWFKADSNNCNDWLKSVNDLITGIQARWWLKRIPGENSLKKYGQSMASWVIAVPRSIADILCL